MTTDYIVQQVLYPAAGSSAHRTTKYIGLFLHWDLLLENLAWKPHMSLVDVVKDISGQTKSKVIFFLQLQIFCLSIDASVFHLNICGFYLVWCSHFGK